MTTTNGLQEVSGQGRPSDAWTLSNTFDNILVQQQFIRKVYGLIFANLLLISAITSFFLYYNPAIELITKNLWILIAASVSETIIVVVIVCCPVVGRKTPYNYILFVLFGILTGVTLGVYAAKFSVEHILIAAASTTAIVLLLTFLAMQTRIHFNICCAIITILMLVLLILGITVLIFKMNILMMVYTCVAILLVSAMIVMNTQAILHGNNPYSFSQEDYITAALFILIDIVSLFRYVLCLVRLATEG